MARLELILIFLLHFEGISGKYSYLYKRVGQDVILPSVSQSSSVTTCSNVIWLYNRERLQTFTEVSNGKVQSSPRASRLNLDSDCSLIVRNITAEDFGLYTCQQRDDTSQYVDIYLNVLTISPSQPDTDSKVDDEITLQCSLSKYREVSLHQKFSIRWLDETGSVLLKEGVDSESVEQTEFVSVLTVRHQGGNNRRYTCQLVDEKNNVETEINYTTVCKDSCSPDFTVWSPLSCFMLALQIAGLILMIVITVIVIRWFTKRHDDDDDSVHDDGNNIMYENIDSLPHLMCRPSKVHNVGDVVVYENMACPAARRLH